MSDPAAPGDLFVVSAPSGTGKTTLCKRLLAELTGLVFSVSHTTRPPRPGEAEGGDYHFVSRDEFEARSERGDFIESATVGGEMYGTSRHEIDAATGSGRDILLDLDTQGAASIRRCIPGAVLIFILPPGLDALKARLRARGTEDAAALRKRIDRAQGEIDRAPLYDFVIVNDNLQAAYDRLRSIVVATRCRASRRFGTPGGTGRSDR